LLAFVVHHLERSVIVRNASAIYPSQSHAFALAHCDILGLLIPVPLCLLIVPVPLSPSHSHPRAVLIPFANNSPSHPASRSTDKALCWLLGFVCTPTAPIRPFAAFTLFFIHACVPRFLTHPTTIVPLFVTIDLFYLFIGQFTVMFFFWPHDGFVTTKVFFSCE